MSFSRGEKAEASYLSSPRDKFRGFFFNEVPCKLGVKAILLESSSVLDPTKKHSGYVAGVHVHAAHLRAHQMKSLLKHY